MSGDFEPWDNTPSKHVGPKIEHSYDYKKARRAEQVRVTIWLLALAAATFLGILWYRGWRP